jgi:hypothetical protein
LNLFSELLDEEVKIFIVTNADENWVKNCLKHFMPDLKDFINENDIKIYSAKKQFSKNLPLEKWKVNF